MQNKTPKEKSLTKNYNLRYQTKAAPRENESLPLISNGERTNLN